MLDYSDVYLQNDPKENLNKKFRGIMVLTVDEKTFSKEVLGSSTPVLVNFWAPWCSLCRIINPLLLRLQAEWGEQLKLVNINADENFKLANTYRLTSLPTVLLFEGGNVHYRLDEIQDREDLRIASEKIQTALETLALRYSYPA